MGAPKEKPTAEQIEQYKLANSVPSDELEKYSMEKLGKNTSEISKSQLKKLIKDIKWENSREARLEMRKNKREQVKKRKSDARLLGTFIILQNIPALYNFYFFSKKENGTEEGEALKKSKRENFNQVSSGITIVLDMSFDSLMRDNEITSISSQVTRCYSTNKTSKKHVDLFVTKLQDKVGTRFNNCIADHVNWSSKYINFMDTEDFKTFFTTPLTSANSLNENVISTNEANSLIQSEKSSSIETVPNFISEISNDKSTPDIINKTLVIEESKNNSHAGHNHRIFDTTQLVYLTADSENEITQFDSSKAYIIGGIVDKNRYPKLTFNKAKELGIPTARLPIGKYLKLSTRKVLTVNHVFEIMLEFIDSGDWEASFNKIIPQRKFKEN
ncbi:tRNA (guanine(9)-N1)-methyltransferase [Smittium culicis]|uniref:tRNA (guanine(9)-N1)-methyltransferase n=1 Tax=Smittium culicis TaxID=133412 RepID=A0A1R1WZL2_9FUNG|nr:tRNA (guanine(9)-N1)-methyltransferase [Smittium culicis]